MEKKVGVNEFRLNLNKNSRNKLPLAPKVAPREAEGGGGNRV